jgi:hypothetical protein
LVVTQAIPVLRITAADSEAGGLKAVVDDAVADVRDFVQAERKISRTRQWQCHSQRMRRLKMLLRSM